MGILTRLLAALTESAEHTHYLTLDCRDNAHSSCDSCDCFCHDPRTDQ